MEKAKIILPIIVILAIVMSVFLVSAGKAGTPALTGIVKGGNYTTMSPVCDPSNDQTLNASIYYNASGGAVRVGSVGIVRLATLANTSINQSSFSVVVNIESLSDLATYNFSCFMSNLSVTKVTEQTQGYVATVDNTAPVISVDIDRESTTVGRSFKYTNALSDALSGLDTTETCTLVDPEKTSYTLSTQVTNKLYETSRLVDDGTWTMTCTATDYASNSNSASVTIKIDPQGVVKTYDGGIVGISKNTIILLVVIGLAILLIWNLRKK